MGLDMYLSAKKYMSRYFDEKDSERIKTVNELFGVEGDEEGDYGAQEVTFRVAYWRKANAIHQWFVDNVQKGTDDCGEYYVTRDQLKQLMELCEQIVADNKKAEELLPTQSGFFFGNTEYNEWYMEDIERTIVRFRKILSDPAFEKSDFYYQASW
jgi:hypothetical protein